MSRKQRPNTAGVSLFPFLDVLVCTMGSLILLLLVATSRIRAAAVDRAKQAAIQERMKSEKLPPSEPEPVVLAAELEVDPTPEWQTRVEQLSDERDLLRKQLTESKRQLAATQSAVMRTKVKAASAQDRLKELREQQDAKASERRRLQAAIDSLQSDLTDAEARLTKAVERQQTAKSKFAFLPFDGRTGTTKRPILIECTQDQIRFLPEDVRLTPAELNGFTTGFNPLLIASRELVHYWKAYERVHSADADPTKDSDSFETDLAALNDKEREPYVLLLIRPNGAVAFHIAKMFLSQLKVPHGYELITDDMEIDAEQPDPEAKKICQAAVTQVLSERDKLLEAIAKHRDQQREQLLLDPDSRSFVQREIDESATGFERPKSSTRTSGSGRDQGSGRTNNGLGNGSGGGFGAGNNAGPTAKANQGTSGGNTNRSSGGNANDLTAAGRDDKSEEGSSAAGGTFAHGTRTPNQNTGRQNSTSSNDNDFAQASGFGDARTLTNPGGVSKNSNGAGTGQRLRTSGSGGASSSGDEPDEEPLPQNDRRYSGNDDTKPFPLSPNGNRNGNASGTSAKSAGASAKSNQANDPGGTSTQRNNDPRAKNRSSNGTSNGQSSGHPSGSSLANAKRRYQMPRSGIGLEKVIPIRIFANRVVVGTEFEIPVNGQVRTESLIDRVLIAMDRVQSDWPSSRPGYHWVPTIKYEVIPGGEQVHQRLNSALFDLGLVSSVEYLDSDPDAVKPSRETSRSRAATPVSGGTR